ncbi:MAG: hypothetical protein KF777_15665 [Planctomycetaceae bacterium]|nr:hypothetical protein [Planctomycetaceae bacterium]
MRAQNAKKPWNASEADSGDWFHNFKIKPGMKSYAPLLEQARESLKIAEGAKRSIEEKAERMLVLVTIAVPALVTLVRTFTLNPWLGMPAFLCFMVTATLYVIARRPIDLAGPVNVTYALRNWEVPEVELVAWIAAANSLAFDGLADRVNPRAACVLWASVFVVLGIGLLALLAV